MRIGFDAKRIFSNSTGLGNYSRNVVSALQETFPLPQYHLYAPRLSEEEWSQDFLNESKYFLHQPQRGSKNTWRNRRVVRDLKRDNIDIYHGLSNELPVRINRTNIKSVVTIHDVLFKQFPNEFPLVDRLIYQRKWKRSCKMADKIVTVSEATKKALFQEYGVPFKKTVVIPPIVDATFAETYTEEEVRTTKRRYQLPEKYLLYVGEIRERKNLMLLMHAYDDLLEEERIPVYVIGRGKTYKNKVEKFVESKPWADQVNWIEDFVPTTHLRIIYQLASVFIYPSLGEGFGIPVAEASLSKTAVITSNTTSLPEAAGPDAICINPKSASQLKEAIQQIMRDENMRKEMEEKSYAYAQRFIDGSATQRRIFFDGIEIVGTNQESSLRFLINVPKQIKNLFRCHRVQVSSGLVGNNYFRFVK